MGDRGVIRCVARVGDFARTNKPDKIEESAEVYVHWHGSRGCIEEILTKAAEILKKKQEKDPGWRQSHFVADPNRVIALIVLAAEWAGADPEVYPPHRAPAPDRPDYIVTTTPKGWFVEGGDFDKRYIITAEGLKSAKD